MKTPIQELIEIYQDLRENGDNDMRTVIHFAESMLEKEKAIIETAYLEGFNASAGGFYFEDDYYNETFKTK